MPSFSNVATGASGAVSSLFSGFASQKKADMFRMEARADLLKGEGARLEGEAYSRAGELALVNKAYAAESTAVQQAQADRQITMALGGQRAAAGASGLLEGGSALDVLRDSASQGALQKEILAKQGLIAEEGYQEQYDVYQKMVEASGIAVQGAQLASQIHMKAAEAEDQAATGHFIGAAVKGVFAIGSLFI